MADLRQRKTGGGGAEPAAVVGPAGTAAAATATTPAPHVDGASGVLLAAQPMGTKWQSFKTRTLSTVCMLGAFFGCLYMGHVYLAVLICIIQTLMVRELFKLARVVRSEQSLPGFRLQQWYFYWAAIFYTYGSFLENNLYAEVSSDARLLNTFGWSIRHHVLISYLLYVFGFVTFVYSLKKGFYMYQITQYCWTHMIIITVVLQSSFFVANIFEGIYWFALPVLTIVFNDITAYLWGFFFGRTPLIKLSPKKTWEGFIGAFFSTLVFSWYASAFLARYQWLTCPRTDLQVSGWLECDDARVFVEQTYRLRDGAAALLPTFAQNASPLFPETMTCMPVQLHALSMASFASIIAPFGGFFASGFKRAFNVKDFGDSIPGHGGLTDRMDCQVIMAAFSYMYYTTFVAPGIPTVGSVLATAARLPPSQQLELYAKLGNMLSSGGIRRG